MSAPAEPASDVRQRVASAWRAVRQRLGGSLLCAVIGLSALFISEHHGGPALLYALLLGLSFHFLSQDARLRPGIDFCGRSVLRVGVALLGARIGFAQVRALGWPTALLVVAGVVLTIAAGLLLARGLSCRRDEGLVSGCAVGICGASAALAVASVLPPTRENERFTLLTVVGVTVLSTLAMLLYPLLVQAAGFSPQQAGVFFGATIHDVAQVVAAGMLLTQAGDTAAADSATIVKLMRVMLLLPVVLVVATWVRHGEAPDAIALDEDAAPRADVPLVPTFLLGFVVLMLLNTAGLLKPPVVDTASTLSRALLVVAIAAAAVKTSLEDLRELGWRPVALLLGETVGLAVFAGLAIGIGIAR